MYVDEDSRVASLVGARKAHRSWTRAAAAGDGQLVARHVELGAARGTRCVQCNDLGAQEVVSRGDVAGNLHVQLAAAVVEVLGAPVVVVSGASARLGRPRVLEDLEPSARAVGAARVADFAEVYHHGAVVSTSDALVGT